MKLLRHPAQKWTEPLSFASLAFPHDDNAISQTPQLGRVGTVPCDIPLQFWFPVVGIGFWL
jgi:hypothetical protein